MWGEGRAPSSRPPSPSLFPSPGSQVQRGKVGSQGSHEVRKSVALTSPSPPTHPSLLPGLVAERLGG